MNSNKLIVAALSLFSLNAISQSLDWRTAPISNTSNYYEIVEKKEKELNTIQGDLTDKQRRELKQFNRWKAFWKDRIKPDGSFIEESNVYSEFIRSQKQNQLTHKSIKPWSLVGPTIPPVSPIDAYAGMGRVNTIAFYRNNTNTVYVGTPSGGVWKTTDAGSTWNPLTDNLPNIGVTDLVISPTDSNTIYLASGDYDAVNTRSLGVFKSTDGGVNWNLTALQFSLGQNDIIGSLLIPPSRPNTILASSKDYINRSTNGGVTWTRVLTDVGQYFNDIIAYPNNDSILLASTKTGKLYYSLDQGASWTFDSSPTGKRLDLAMTPAAPYTIYLLDEDGNFAKYYDGASSATLISSISNYDSQGGYNQVIAVSPLDSNLIIVGGVHGWRSTNGGISWQKYLDGYWSQGDPSFYVHSDHHEMVFVPNSNLAFSGNDGGIHAGDASLNTAWTDYSAGLAITQYYSIAGTPLNSNFLLMGAQDNDVSRYNGAAWSGLNPSSDGVETLWDYSNSNIAWTASQEGGLDRTTDGFQTSTSLNTPTGAPFVWELEINPVNPKSIYGGFSDIFKSINRGDSWTNLNSGAGEVESIGIAPSDSNTIYVSGFSDFVRTTNGGISWSSLAIPRNGKISSIAVHPTDPQTAYITFAGYTQGKIYKTTNGGSSWSDITGTLPDVPAHKVLYKTGTTSEELFVATDLGVYYKTTQSSGWQKLGTGLPNVIVNDMEIDYATEKIRAATFGRGVWETSIDRFALGLEQGSIPSKSIQIYPNPAKNKQFTISLTNLGGQSNILVFNSIGAIVKEYNTANSQIDVDLNGYSTGVYIVKVSNGNNSSIMKIIIE